MLYDGLTCPEQASWRVRTCSMVGELMNEDYYFLDERKAYGCYLYYRNSPLMPERVALMQKRGSRWETLAEDGIWNSAWRPTNKDDVEEAIQLFLDDEKYIEE